MDETVHLLKNRFNRNSNLFLLLIPIVVFVLVLAIFITKVSKPTVLGENATQLDNAGEIR